MSILELSSGKPLPQFHKCKSKDKGRRISSLVLIWWGGGLRQAAEPSFSGFFEMPRGRTFPQEIFGKGDPLQSVTASEAIFKDSSRASSEIAIAQSSVSPRKPKALVHWSKNNHYPNSH